MGRPVAVLAQRELVVRRPEVLRFDLALLHDLDERLVAVTDDPPLANVPRRIHFRDQVAASLFVELAAEGGRVPVGAEGAST
eukprot:scaffold1740_cov254-Pinguiococcus_pyrenoidosus.AAC.22